MPRTLIILNYYWPPSGGSAVQRWLSFANLLAEKGYRVYVITVDDAEANYPSRDETLVAKVSPEISIIKTKTSEVFWLYKKFVGKGKAPAAGFANEGKPGLLQMISRFIRGNFFLPDARRSWMKYALPAAEKLIAGLGTEVTVITAGPPHSTHLTGKKLKEKYNCYWIADFHDAWTDVWYYDKLMHTSLAAAYDKTMERSVLEKADKIFTVGEYLKEVLAAKSPMLGKDKIEVVSMGYDQDDFYLTPARSQDGFVITYTGTIDDSYQPEVFFEALKKVKNNNPDVKYILRFVGILSEGLQAQISKFGLLNILDVTGYVSHDESVNFLKKSDVLLLVSPKVKSEAIIIPGKLYEYLAARKPILNIGSLKTDTARIVTLCEAGKNFDRNMDADMEMWLQQLTDAWKENQYDISLKNSNTNYKNYSRRNEAEKISNLLGKI